MAVESDEVDAGEAIFSPYTGEEYYDCISCPNCGSDKIHSWTMDANYNILKYKCAECGEIFDADEAERR